MESLPSVAGSIYGLHCICHPEDGVRYVGRTIRPVHKRLVQHKGQAKRGSEYPVHRWIRKHGEENVFAQTLEQTDDYQNLSEMEGRWIENMAQSGSRLLNMASIEDGKLLYRHSVETRAKISAGQLGKKIPQSVIDFRREAFSGEGNGMSKLTADEVVEICTLIWESIPLKDIADIYGVRPSQITRIAKGERWKSVPRPWGEEIPNLLIGRKFPTRRKVKRLV